jgi:antitoxin (DNA-binding transcriptional repressor) of toxin-antitoxin stability system
MRTVSIAELRQNPTPVLDAAEAGETTVVTRYRKPIAEIKPFQIRTPSPHLGWPGNGPSGREIMSAMKKMPKLRDNSWFDDIKRLRELDETEAAESVKRMEAAGW